jgi:hypothetical protein
MSEEFKRTHHAESNDKHAYNTLAKGLALDNKNLSSKDIPRIREWWVTSLKRCILHEKDMLLDIPQSKRNEIEAMLDKYWKLPKKADAYADCLTGYGKECYNAVLNLDKMCSGDKNAIKEYKSSRMGTHTF